MPDRQRLLELALKGLEAERAKIGDEIAQIKSQLNPQLTAEKKEGGNRSTTTTVKKKRTMSKEARKKISEAMKRRYAEKKKAG